MEIQTDFQCPECNRVFNVMIEEQADEWFYGHDCDPHLGEMVTYWIFDRTDTFEEQRGEMETEDILVYTAARSDGEIHTIVGYLRGEHEEHHAQLRDQYGDDVELDGPWFPHEREVVT